MKLFLKSLTALLLILATASTVFASALSIRVEEPKSPTNQKNFKLGFVVLDINNNPVSVKCEFKGPSDGSFAQFDSTQNLIAGGTSGACQVTYNQISPIGNYKFRAVATSDTGTEVSNEVSVDYDDSRPGKPENYGKEKISDGTFKITFKTANDAKTVKVEVYRSDSTSFDLNGGTKVGEVALGPNQNGEFTNTVPDASKTYYFALRAFDSAGNTSDPVGDSMPSTIVTTQTTGTPGQPALGAIPVSGSGSILGETDTAGTDSATVSPTPLASPKSDEGGFTTGLVQGAVDQVKESMQSANNKVMYGIGLLLAASIAYWFFAKRHAQ